MAKFEMIFEISIKYLRPHDKENVDFEELALFSLGLDDLGVRIYKYLKEKKIVTIEEILSTLQVNEDEIIDRLDYMYSLGIIDHLGRGYIYRWPLHEAIRRKVAKRIEELLERIARLAEGRTNE